MNARKPVGVKTTRPFSPSEKRVLAVVLANVAETRQASTSAPLSVVSMADFREWFPSLSGNRARELLGSIVQVQWGVDSCQPMPIFWNVIDKGSTFVIEVDSAFIAQRAAERGDATHHLPELVGQAEADACEALKTRGLAVRFDTRDGQSPAPFQSADIRRDRANLKIEHGIVVRAYIG
ncbi:hypothetical protein bAD24_p00795 (plasmid) [Burkholderia sp. AD24]|nr:hypothetical protein bAD24_p00795 [Burkholderia sp. AD24]